ncbi:MAG TPA: FG-GAP-like repeat-containing protein [Vicinamibacteria bacterium]|nr:FG-GAP-like repeat-containing protein [Vicinamibacteria bacterium]
MSSRPTAGWWSRVRPLLAAGALGLGLWWLPDDAASQGRPAGRQDESPWNRRAPGMDYKTAVEISGRLEITRFLSDPANGRSLQATCDVRREAQELMIPGLEGYLEKVQAEGRDVQAIAQAHHDLAQAYSAMGRMAEATQHFGEALRIVREKLGQQPGARELENYLELAAGVTELRRGELENCVHLYNPDRCLFPLRGGGVHDLPSGAAAAALHFARILDSAPDDLEARWLLNVAYMALGQYPHRVPKAQLVPPEAWSSPDDPGRFVDTAPLWGIDAPGLAGASVVEDMDGDGLLDVIFTSVETCAPLRYYRGRETGGFLEVTQAAGLSGQLGGINAVQADYNNDGLMDLYVMRGGWQRPMRNSLLRQNPDGTFSDVTREAGIEQVARTQSAAWADYDGDGLLDLFVGHEETPSTLFRNRGDGTFEDVTAKAGVGRTAFTKAVAWGDYDNDGWPDLYVSNLAGENFLYHNERNGTFREVAKEMGVEGPLMSFPAWFFDYDNDGRLDLFVGSFVNSITEVARDYLKMPAQAETQRLYRNTGSGFEDVTRRVGLDHVLVSMGANFGDIDNDGWLDVYVGTGAPSYAALMPNHLYRNREGRSFADVTTATDTGHLQKGHGVSFADLRGEGNEDIVTNIGGFVPGDGYNRIVFENPGHPNDWVVLHLTGVRTNRSALGARIAVTVEGKDGSVRTIHRVVTSGGSFGSSPLAQHVGLGRAKRIRSVEVRWPAGGMAPQTFLDVPMRQRIEIREGDRAFRVLPVRKMSRPAAPPTAAPPPTAVHAHP